MSLKKVAELSKQFQIKLAQSGIKGDPLDFETAKKDLGAITDVKDYGHSKSKIMPKLEPKPAPVPQPTNVPTADALPADLKKMLDVGAPGLKGMLRLTIDGNRVGVDYNADRWRHGASAVKKVLTNALFPKFLVGDPIGHFNPNWTFNY